MSFICSIQNSTQTGQFSTRPTENAFALASVSFPHWCLTQSCMATNHHNCRPDSGWHQWRFIAMCDCRIPVTSQRSHIWKLHFSVHPDFPVDIVSGGKIWLLLGCYSVLLIKLLGVGSKRMTLSGVDSGQWILYSGWHENLLGLKPSLFRFSFHSAAGFTELDPTPQAQFNSFTLWSLFLERQSLHWNRIPKPYSFNIWPVWVWEFIYFWVWEFTGLLVC